MRLQGSFCLGLAVAVSGAFCVFAVGSGALAAGESLSRQLPLKAGGRLMLANTRGDIHISSWDQERVEIKAETTAESEDDAKLVPVDIQGKEDEIRITSTYPVYAPDLRVRIDYHLRVPGEIDLKWIRSVNGDVTVSEVSGRLIVQVDNGEITVHGFSGILKATTINGKIEAELSRADEASFVSLDNYNGEISLRLPRNLKAHWAVRTMNGLIESSIPFTILDEFGPKVVHLNEREEPVISLYSVNGDIRIAER